MEKRIETGNMIPEYKEVCYCDQCNKEIKDCYHIPIEFNSIYSEYSDVFGCEYQFCSLNCLINNLKSLDEEDFDYEFGEGVTLRFNSFDEYKELFNILKKL